MLFPIGDENIQGKNKPIISYTFIFLNVFIFFATILGPYSVEKIYQLFATVPVEIMRGESLYTLGTNMFLHGDLFHLFGNMLFLWIFADNLEIIIGNLRFLIFYLIGGIVASIIFVLFNQESTLYTLGASGAMAAIMGAYLVFFPNSKIKTFVLLFLVKIRAYYFMIIWFVFQVVYSILELNKAADEGGAAWMAHIGGFLFGLLLARLMKRYQLFDPAFKDSVWT